MIEYLNQLEGWGVPSVIIGIIASLFILSQIIGELIEVFGKTSPKILKHRNKIKEKLKAKKEKEQKLLTAFNTMNDVKVLLNEVNMHYSADCIKQRNECMHNVDNQVNWTHERAQVYDASVEQLLSLKELIEEMKVNQQYNGEITAQLYKDFCRNRILDFAHKIINAENSEKPVIYSKEEFKKIRGIYDDYEAFLERFGGSNGEVDDAMIVIREAEFNKTAYNIDFIEDIRR